jgi:capsular polysaccharide biosynthesis protein
MHSGTSIDPSRWGLTPAAISAGQGGDLVALLDIKNSLVERFGVEDGFAAYRKALNLRDCDHLRLTSLRGLREAAAERSILFHELAPAGERFSMSPPRVIGEGNHRALEGVGRSIFVACLADARVRGRSAFIKAGDVALLDYEGEELRRLDDRLTLDPAVFSAVDDRELWMIEPKREDGSVQIDEAFTLLGPHTVAFGHWMWEYLPKYLIASMSDLLPAVPVLIDSDMPSTHRQSLELMLPRGVQVIELAPFATANVRRLWCAPSQMHMPIFAKLNERAKWDYLASPPSRFAPIIREMIKRTEPAMSPKTANTSERVFLARHKQTFRKMVNREVIEAAAEARGFHVICAEDLTFAEQASLLRHARFVVGPEGSAMALLFFAKPGTRVLILQHSYTAGSPLLASLLREVGITVTMMTGPYVHINQDYAHFSDYEIDSQAFSCFLDDELELSGPRTSARQLRPSAALRRLWAALRLKASTLASRQWK